MRLVLTLIGKEFRSFWRSPLGWILFTFTILMEGLCLSTAMKGLLDSPLSENLVYVTFHTPNFWFFFLFLFPLLTMRCFAEEERSGTLETLLTAPIDTWQIVLSKFTAQVFFYVLLWVPGLFVFHSFSTLTDLPTPFLPEILFSTHLFLLAIGAYFIAVGCLASSLTANPIIAGIVTAGLLVIHYFIGFVTIIWGDQFPAARFFEMISAQQHLSLFSRGILDTRPLILYALLTLFVLVVTHHTVNYRRWKR